MNIINITDIYDTIDINHVKGMYTTKITVLDIKADMSIIPTIYAPHFSNRNEGHFFIDVLFPLYITILKCNLLDKKFNLLCLDPIHNTEYCDKSLNILKSILNPQQIFYERGKIFDHLIYTTIHVNEQTVNLINKNFITNDSYWFINYDYDSQCILKYMKEFFLTQQFKLNTSFRIKNCGNKISLFESYRKYIYSKYNINNTVDDKFVIISMHDYRRILNIVDVVNVIQNKGFKVQCVNFYNLSMEEQLNLISKCKCLIGSPGGPVTNSIFLQNEKIDTYVIELWPTDAKFFYRKYYVQGLATLSAGNILIECDKSYDNKDLYKPIERQEDRLYVYKDCNINKLINSQKTVDIINDYPHACMYPLVDISMHIDLSSLEESINMIN